jgi:hypothetical protein
MQGSDALLALTVVTGLLGLAQVTRFYNPESPLWTWRSSGHMTRLLFILWIFLTTGYSTVICILHVYRRKIASDAASQLMLGLVWLHGLIIEVRFYLFEQRRLLTILQAFILVTSSVPAFRYTAAVSSVIAGILQVVGLFVFSLDQTGRIFAYTGGRVFHVVELLVIVFLVVRFQEMDFLKRRKFMSFGGIYICATLAGFSFILILDRLWFCAVSHPMHVIIYGVLTRKGPLHPGMLCDICGHLRPSLETIAKQILT